ncbi:hypothetical protein INR49_011518 [Caranx melampygus]|nr:hypothetical protein INR49_011518 [Caranx melampygus]
MFDLTRCVQGPCMCSDSTSVLHLLPPGLCVCGKNKNKDKRNNKTNLNVQIKFHVAQLNHLLPVLCLNVNKVCFDPSPGCDMCADNRNGECPMHGPLHSLRRLVGTSSSAAPVTLPDVPDWLRDLPREVCLCTSTVPGLGYGICAAQRIPQGTWIGPFQGQDVRGREGGEHDGTGRGVYVRERVRGHGRGGWWVHSRS